MAFGNNTEASANSAIAFGDVSTASATSAIAMGTGATADAEDAVAIGTNASATNGKAVSIGAENVASGDGAVAIGDPNTATGNGAVAQGMDNTATGDGTVALGNTNMVGGGGQAVGTAGTAAQGAIGIGYQNEVIGQGSVALGNTSSALGAGAVAIGDTAEATIVDSVALGSGSLANGDTLGDAAFQPLDAAGNPIAVTAPTATSEVSVGDAGSERRITNVAAGSADTDAVNVSQLAAVDQKAGTPLTFAGDSGTNVDRQLGETLNVTGGAAGTLTDDNIGVVGDGTDTLAIQLAENIDLGTNGSVTTGNSTLDDSGLAVGDGSGNVTTVTNDGLTVANGGPSVTNSGGIDAGGQVISNVADGVADGDAVNVSQLNGVSDVANAGWNLSAQGGGATNVAPDGEVNLRNADGNLNVTQATANGREEVTFDLANEVSIGTDGPTLNDDGIDMGGDTVTNVGDPVDGGDAVNLDYFDENRAHYYSVNDDGVQGGNYDNDGATGVNAIAAGVDATATGDGSLAMGFGADARQADGIALGSSAISQGASSIAMGDGATNDVFGNNQIAIGSNASSFGEDDLAIGTGAAASGQRNIALGTDASTDVGILDGIAIGTDAYVGANNGIAMGNGASADHAGSVALGTDSVTAAPVGTTDITLAGTNYTFAGGTPTGTVSVGDVGNERTLTNVAAGRISASSTDAINGSQLFATNQAVEDAAATASQGWNLSAQNGGATNVAPGGEVNLRNADGNLEVTQATANGREEVTFDLANEVSIGPNGPTLNDSGIDMNGDTITNVGDPVDGGDAVNLDYFDENRSHYYSVNDGGTQQDNYANDGADGVDSMAAGVAASTGAGAERALALGYNTSATGVDSVAIGQYASAESGGAVAIGRDATANGGQAISIGYGNTATGDGAVSIGDPSTAIGDGALALGKDNYAEGTGAVAVGNNNTSEGDGALAIGDSNTADGNGSITMGVNNQATGDGAVAMGNDNMVTGDGAFAVGNNATSGALDTLALGTEASATSQHAMALGNSSDASGFGAFAAGNTAEASGDGAMAVGQVSTASGLRSSAIGLETVSSAEDALAVGTEAEASGLRSTAIGNFSVSSGQAALAMGSNSQASVEGSVALGARSNVLHEQSVALGAATETVRGAQTGYTGYGKDTTEDSVGEIAIAQVAVFDDEGVQLTEPGNRQITGVAAGVEDTDAVNVSQLKGIETHYYSVNDDGVIGGNYDNDGATGANAIASGVDALASTEGSVALGSGSVANRALASASGAIPAGSATITYNTTDKELLGAVSVGDSDSYRQITNVADGTQSQDAVTVRQLQGAMESVTITGTKYFHANSDQPDSLAVGEDSIAVGPTTVVNGDAGIGMGNGATVGQMAPGGTAIGDGAEVMLADGMALGTESLSEAQQGIALGAGATVSHDQSVALGSNSVTAEPVATPGTTIAGTDYDFAGITPDSTVSVGDAGDERTVTNVASGRVNETSTDAVNGSQLYAATQSIESLSDEVEAGQTHYYSVNDGGTQGGNYANDGATGVNSIAAGVDATATADGAIAMGDGATASETDSVAMGSGATTEAAVGTADITVGGQTYAFAGASPVGTFSVGSAGAERTITNVAAGRISADSTDAINGSQLYATNQAVENVDGRVSNVEGDVNELDDRVTNVEGDVSNIGNEIDQLDNQAVQYDTNGDGSVDYDSITLEGDEGTTISNVGDGEVSETSSDVVNGSQLWEVQEQITNIETGETKYFKANSEAADARAEGAESVAMGPESVARGDHSVATGDGAVAESEGGVALGAGSQATREGMNGAEEAFSGESVASAQGAVSVGSEGGERQITHVAGGTQATDAVNVRQLESVQAGSVSYDRNDDGSVDYSSVTLGQEGTPTQIHNVAAGEAPTDAANVGQLQELNQQFNQQIGGLSNRIDDVEDYANAGSASAIAAASVPQAYLPGKSMVSAGAGTYSGESAVSVGVSRLSENGRWAVKLNATGDSQGNFGAGVGAGFHW
nr:YadA-like family protein [Halomonas halmophila]